MAARAWPISRTSLKQDHVIINFFYLYLNWFWNSCCWPCYIRDHITIIHLIFNTQSIYGHRGSKPVMLVSPFIFHNSLQFIDICWFEEIANQNPSCLYQPLVQYLVSNKRLVLSPWHHILLTLQRTNICFMTLSKPNNENTANLLHTWWYPLQSNPASARFQQHCA